MRPTARVTWRDFGPFIRHVRESQGISQEQLGQRLGCGRIHVYRLEHGHRHPSRVLLRLLRQLYIFQPPDAELLDAFELLLESNCDAIDTDVAQAWPRFGSGHAARRGGY